jgi:hypothetical protein
MMTPEEKVKSDRERLVPVLELHDILEHYMLTGTFSDETHGEVFVWAGFDKPEWPPIHKPGFQ